MQLTPQLRQKITQAVRISMRIEGYRATASIQAQAQARVLMVQHGVKVSVPTMAERDLKKYRL
jgi:hypothetical protein